MRDNNNYYHQTWFGMNINELLLLMNIKTKSRSVYIAYHRSSSNDCISATSIMIVLMVDRCGTVEGCGRAVESSKNAETDRCDTRFAIKPEITLSTSYA